MTVLSADTVLATLSVGTALVVGILQMGIP